MSTCQNSCSFRSVCLVSIFKQTIIAFSDCDLVRRGLTKEIKLPENDFADSITCGLQRLFGGLPQDESAGARKTILYGFPKDDSADPERRFRGLTTDDPRLSAQTFTEIRGFPTFTEICNRLPRKSANFRK